MTLLFKIAVWACIFYHLSLSKLFFDSGLKKYFITLFLFHQFCHDQFLLIRVNKLLVKVTGKVPLQNGYSPIKDISPHRTKSPLRRMRYGTLLCNYRSDLC